MAEGKSLAIDVLEKEGCSCDVMNGHTCGIHELARIARSMQGPQISIEIYQQDFIPGWAAYFADEDKFNPDAKPLVVLNIGSLLAAVESGDLPKEDLPYMVAESLMHEVIHVLEHWAGVEFNEDRVEELLTKYREKYQRGTVWQYESPTPVPPTSAAPRGDKSGMD